MMRPGYKWTFFLYTLVFALVFSVSCSKDALDGPGFDDTAPTVSAVAPADGSSSVSTAVSVVVTFSEDVKASTVNDTTLDVGGTPGAILVTGKTATFTPTVPFNRGTTYVVTVTTGVTDRSGNAMQADFSTSFVTESSNALFVSTTGTDGPDRGTIDKPYLTIQAAIDSAVAGDHINIIAGPQPHAQTETLVLKEGVSIYGGFDNTGLRDPEQFETIIEGATIAISGEDADSVTIDGLTILSATPSTPGDNSIAISLNKSRGVVITRNKIIAGPGSHGNDGADGAATASKGGNGGNGGSPENYSWGSGGSSPVSGRSGGRGGEGGRSSIEHRGEGGYDGGPGVANGGGGGGNAGQNAGANGSNGTGGARAGGANAPDRADPGAAGFNFGNFDGSAYYTSSGSPGRSGAHGNGGGGGGGGASSTLGVNGGGGGGGGGGGQGGDPGRGGGGGGASFGILLMGNTDVTIRDNIIQTGDAGQGGDGGVGAPGGAGGAGRAGKDTGNNGGNGGSGRNGSGGQAGGHGGGGGGGPSIGIVIGDRTDVTRSNNTFTIGAGGAGGGGHADGNPGQAGQAGETKEL